ncbi:MAG: hypothetical protein ABIJ96_02275 [Elusimicrobiota bacterium]
MAKRRRVFVDFDDVLCATAIDLIRLLQEEFGKSVVYEDLHDFDLGISFGLDNAELKRFFAAAHRPERILGIPPIAGAREALAAWTARGLEVCIVTGRPTSTREASAQWLRERGMPYAEMIFVDKYRRATPDSDAVSLEALADMEFALAVDDAPPMLEFLLARMTLPVVIVDRPWNRQVAVPAGRAARRCRGWAEIAAAAEELAV